MITKKQLHIIKSYILEIEKLIRQNKNKALPKVIKESVKDTTHIIFSDIRGKVKPNSPKHKMLLFDTSYNARTGKKSTKVLFGLDHVVNDPDKKRILNTRQDYYDNIVDNFSDKDGILYEAKRDIINLIYIYFDIQGKTKHFIYIPDKKYKAIEYQLANLKFKNERNTSSKYTVLDIRNDNLINSQHHKQTICIVTYIPKSFLADWKCIDDYSMRLPIINLHSVFLICIKNLFYGMHYHNKELDKYLINKNNELVKRCIYFGMKDGVSALSTYTRRFLMDSVTKKPLLGLNKVYPSVKSMADATQRVSYYVLITVDARKDASIHTTIGNLMHDYIYAYLDIQGRTQHFILPCKSKVVSYDSVKKVFYKKRSKDYQILDCHRSVYYNENKKKGLGAVSKPVEILTYIPKDKLKREIAVISASV